MLLFDGLMSEANASERLLPLYFYCPSHFSQTDGRLTVKQ